MVELLAKVDAEDTGVEGEGEGEAASTDANTDSIMPTSGGESGPGLGVWGSADNNNNNSNTCNQGAHSCINVSVSNLVLQLPTLHLTRASQ